ncbi:hypothetical protein [Geminicoccus flavidas]|uniref:hypothetical protein n=1 Tax=Geminicoccus flavidas TaxID=2506407 RepID=UPI00135868EC|nr:hypothetical protein [Geminicoccus flavidas]
MYIDAERASFGPLRRTVASRLGQLKEWVSAHLAERRLQQAIISLNDQDDFVLLDLGIRRDQIAQVVRHGRPANRDHGPRPERD